MTEKLAPTFQVKVAQNLPIINTGRIALIIQPTKAGASTADIIVQVNQSALLVPGDYQVIPKTIANLPTDPIAHISYDRTLQYFKVNVVPDNLPAFEAQFSVLVNLDLIKN